MQRKLSIWLCLAKEMEDKIILFENVARLKPLGATLTN
jgi:hypothetical protein